MREIIAKWILKMFEKYGLLRFESYKSLTHLEQYTDVYFMDKLVSHTVWSELEKMKIP